MLSKCANPACSRPFLYFRKGKLFRVERQAPLLSRDESAMPNRKLSPIVEYYWLCEDCAAGLTLSRTKEGGVVVQRQQVPVIDVGL